MSRFVSEYVMVHPTNFSIQYEINPYMGGVVDLPTAIAEWTTVKELIESNGAVVRTVYPEEIFENTDTITTPAELLPDSVFAANHGMFLDSETFLVSQMRGAERTDEEQYVRAYMAAEFDNISLIDSPVPFEGYGDFYDDEFTEFVWAGYGIRSEEQYITELKKYFPEDKIIPLELHNEWFYHLDTCFFILDKDTALIEAEAFTAESEERIEREFETVHRCNSVKSDGFIPCNSIHLPNGKILTSNENQSVFNSLVDEEKMVYTSVGEFKKGGGGVRCMVLPIIVD